MYVCDVSFLEALNASKIEQLGTFIFSRKVDMVTLLITTPHDIIQYALLENRRKQSI